MKRRLIGALAVLAAVSGSLASVPASAATLVPSRHQADTDGNGTPERIIYDTDLAACASGGYVLAPVTGERIALIVGTGGRPMPLITYVDNTDADAADQEINLRLPGASSDADGDGDIDINCGAVEGPFAGFTCGFASSNDPTAQVEQNPDIQNGEVDGGPWLAIGADSVTITCTISVADGVIDAGDTSVSQVTPGMVGSVAGTIRYTAAAGQDVYLCTQANWTYPTNEPFISGGVGTWRGVTDDPDGNPFCDLAISVEPDPNNPTAVICETLGNPNPPCPLPPARTYSAEREEA